MIIMCYTYNNIIMYTNIYILGKKSHINCYKYNIGLENILYFNTFV